MPTVEIIEADLYHPEHQQAIAALTAAYALDEFGNGDALPPEVLARLIPGLQNTPTALVFLAWRDGVPVGIANCFRGFSTFLGAPLINIHDLAVLPGHRGQQIGRRLLEKVDEKARELGCLRVTLEVHESNALARRIYEKQGFAHAWHKPGAGGALFYSKTIRPA